MNRSDENNLAVIGPTNIRGGVRIGDRKASAQVSRNRRALGDLNREVVAPFPCVNKSALKEKHVVSNKNPVLPPVNRPITRRFAAELANKQQHCPMETEKPTSSILNPSELEDCLIIDVEEYRAANEWKAPMPIDEEVLDEVDEMEEDEEEEMSVEPIRRDIDERDQGNPHAVVEYVNDIYSYYKKVENFSCVSPNYMDEQCDINHKMRAVLIDWLIEVHFKFDLRDETLFLMVNLIDRFLARKTIQRKELQLVGVTALLLACKYEEVAGLYSQDLITITDNSYTKQELLDMEKLMVNTLQFNLSFPTPYQFMRRYLKVVESNDQLKLLSFFMIELSLVEYEMLKYPPSLLAAAAIFTAQCTINRLKHWNPTSEWHTKYSEDQLLECAKRMVHFHQNAGIGKQTAVHRKYGCATSTEPALFLLKY